MLYGYTNGNVTVVGAATSVMELEGWYQRVMEEVSGLFSSRRETEIMDLFTNSEFTGYQHPAYIFTHISDDEQNSFIETHEIKIIPSMHVKDRMLDMMALVNDDLRSGFDLRDSRTIGELAGIADESAHDPWDKRTEAEKEAAKSNEKRTDELRKRLGDHVTGQSFDPNPRSGSQDGLKITEIFGDAQGGMNIKGRKFGSGSGTKSSDPLKNIAEKMRELVVGKKDETITDEMIEAAGAKLDEVGYTADEIIKIKDNFDLNDIDGRREYVEIANQENRRKKLAAALAPVEGSKSKEEILEEVKSKLSDIDGISSDEIDDLMGAVEAKLDQPTPKPGDYKFALNQRLTNEPAMRGAGTPIFTFAKNENGPNKGSFNMSDLPLLFPVAGGFDMVSGNIYEFTGGTAEDGVDILRTRGFIEDPDIIEAERPKLVQATGAYVPTLDDFAKVLAGNGTSTASITDSWGRIVVGMVSDPELEELSAGISGEQGAVLDQFAGVKNVKFDELPASIKNVIGKDLMALESEWGKQLKIGDYNGVNVASSNRFPLIETASHKIRNDISGNVQDFGGVRVEDNVVRIFSRDNQRYKGVVVFESTDDVIIIMI